MSDHDASVQRLAAQLRAAPFGAARLGKHTSNLFRDRRPAHSNTLDVRQLNAVLEVNRREGYVDVEGMAPYDAIVEAALREALMPAVVPQLKSITLGGAAAGVGIEATSFRHGLVHDTLLEIEVLTGEGKVVSATPDNAHADLFFGFPNSYGTLGYALRLKAKAIPVSPYVEVRHRRFTNADACFAALDELSNSDVDFLDAVVFARDELYVSAARFVDQAPGTSDYSFERIYYRSIRAREVDYLTTTAYLWRWDTDWFWCSKNLGAQHPVIRRLLGRERLNSRFYTKVMRWNSRVGLTAYLDKLSGHHRESIIQDVDIPIAHAARFLDFLHDQIGLLPIWICPIRSPRRAQRFALYPLAPGQLYVNFGFWDVKRTREPHPPGHFNRLIEARVGALGGIKSLYSDSYFTEDEFWRIYDGETYRALKRRYDPNGRFPDLYQKCVLKH
ncbi:MAG TPA: FAD-binding oxidoreductase [Burkholderiales bacterium]|nr:FAD-binding oxidoreductase [Burkholderiales bacterium]